MRNLFSILMLALLGAPGSCTVGARKDLYLFTANYYGKPVDLRIGAGPVPVYDISGLAPGKISTLKRIGGVGDLSVAYRVSGDIDWQRLPRELAGVDLSVATPAVACVVFDTRGFIRWLDLSDDSRPGARVSFFNATDRTVPFAGLYAAERADTPVVWAKGVPPFHATRFSSIVPGDYFVSVGREPARFGGGIPGMNAPSPDARVRCADFSYLIVFLSRGVGGRDVVQTRRIADKQGARGLASVERENESTFF